MLDNKFIFKIEELYKEGYRILDEALYELDGENGKLPIFSDFINGETRTIKDPEYFRKKREIYNLMSRLERKVQEITILIQRNEGENRPSSLYDKAIILKFENFIKKISQSLYDQRIILPD